MKTEHLLSLRAAARELQIDRATLARIVAERRVPAAGRRAGHDVFEYAALRRAVDLEWYGGSSNAPAPSCPECWGPLAHHGGGKPCPPGSHEFTTAIGNTLYERAPWRLWDHTGGDLDKALALVRKWLAQLGAK